MLNGGEERGDSFFLGANNAAAPCRFLAYSAVQKTKKKYGLKSAAIRSATLQIPYMGLFAFAKKDVLYSHLLRTHATDAKKTYLDNYETSSFLSIRQYAWSGSSIASSRSRRIFLIQPRLPCS